MRQLQRLLRPALKHARVSRLLEPAGVRCEHVELADAPAVRALFERAKPAIVIHLAAQAGVRYSITHPEPYVQSNLVGFANILEASPTPRGAAPRVRQLEQRVWRPQRPAVSRVAGHRLTGIAVCRHQEGQRTDGSRLQPSVRPARHRVALLHGLRPVGAARHGLLQFCREASGRAAAAGVRWRHACSATSPTSTTSSRAWSASRRARRSRAPPAHEIFNIGNHQPVSVLEFIRDAGRAPGHRASAADAADAARRRDDDLRRCDKTCASVWVSSRRLRWTKGCAASSQWFKQWKGVSTSA